MYHCRHTNYHHASHLYRVLFAIIPKRDTLLSNFWQRISRTVGCIPTMQAINRFVLFACLDRVLFFYLKWSIKQVLTVDLSAHAVGAGRLLIARSMNNITGPTVTRTEPGYKLNCTGRGTLGGVRDLSSVQIAML